MAPSKTEHPDTNSESHNEYHTVTSKSSEPIWRVESIPGKDKGVIATQDIIPGTLIMSDPALITTECVSSMETAEKDIARALRVLPKESQRAYLSLHNNYPGKNPLQNIIRSNGYPLGHANAEAGGIFLNVSRINHSCRPNAKHTWNSDLQRETVYAVRPICEGEEITVSYLKDGCSKDRKQELSESFLFKCSCEVCSLPAAELKKSDARILRAEALDRTIGNWDSARHTPAKVMANGRKLLGIYREEDICDDRLPNLYWDIFQVVIMHGDEARASEFARKYCELKTLSEGPESTEVKETVRFVEKPSEQTNFGETADWKSSVADVPTGLDEESFEKWLWRENL